MPPNATSPTASAAASTAYVAGRLAGRVRPAVGGAARVGAAAGAVAVTALWAGVYGWVNLIRYRRGQTSRKRAVRDTAAESLGIGLATGAGLAAANAVRFSALLASSTALLPFLVGAIVTGGAKTVWDLKVKNRLSGDAQNR